MYQFRKKFKRSNDFFYNNVERKGNTQKDDANSSVSYESQFFEQVNEFGDLNEQSEDIAENYDKHQELTTKTQDSEDVFTKQSISVITEESKQPCQHSQSHLSPTGHYTGLLLQFDFASNVSRQQSFVVHDYNANKRTIMHNSFVFVHRYPHLLLDGYGWILCCSCDANRKQFVEALPNNIQLDPHKDIPYPSCIHISAMEKYLVVYDRKFGIEAKDFIEKKSTSMMQSVFSDHSYHEMQPEEDLFSAVCREVQWIAVKPVNSPWGVCTFVYSKVTPPQPELKCCSCSSYHCIHVTTLAKAMQIVEEDEMDSPLALFKCSFGITSEMRDYFELATLSKEKVSLFETGNENDTSDFTDLPEKNGHKILAPSERGICSCGSEWDKRSIQDEWLMKTQQGDYAKVTRPKKKHGTFIPGIFCILCPRGICYGFEIMRDHESPNIPFTILRTRFPDAPELVIYDNACRLHEYCLNRDAAYNMNLYPMLNMYNSQAAEQCNSCIKPLASMVSYKEYDNFFLFTKLHIWHRNMLRIVKYNPEREIAYKHYFLTLSRVIH